MAAMTVIFTCMRCAEGAHDRCQMSDVFACHCTSGEHPGRSVELERWYERALSSPEFQAHMAAVAESEAGL